jgi:hypothetical protein
LESGASGLTPRRRCDVHQAPAVELVEVEAAVERGSLMVDRVDDRRSRSGLAAVAYAAAHRVREPGRRAPGLLGAVQRWQHLNRLGISGKVAVEQPHAESARWALRSVRRLRLEVPIVSQIG